MNISLFLIETYSIVFPSEFNTIYNQETKRYNAEQLVTKQRESGTLKLSFFHDEQQHIRHNMAGQSFFLIPKKLY